MATKLYNYHTCGWQIDPSNIGEQQLREGGRWLLEVVESEWRLWRSTNRAIVKIVVVRFHEWIESVLHSTTRTFQCSSLIKRETHLTSGVIVGLKITGISIHNIDRDGFPNATRPKFRRRTISFNSVLPLRSKNNSEGLNKRIESFDIERIIVQLWTRLLHFSDFLHGKMDFEIATTYGS